MSGYRMSLSAAEHAGRGPLLVRRPGDQFEPHPLGCDSSELQALKRLAKERSSESRRELMCRLSDFLTVEPETQSTDSVALLGDILVSLVHQLEVPDRAELSRRVARSEVTPRELALTLAQDEAVCVAEPMLAQSPVVTDDDLMEVVATQSQDHLLAVTRRDQLSPRVTDGLIERGTTAVLQSVAEHAGAAITETGFRRLIEAAPVAAGVMEALSRRADIPESIAESALAIMPSGYRERLERILSADASTGERLIEGATRHMAEARLSEKRGLLEAKVAARDVERGARSLADVVREFAGADRPREVARVLATIAKLPEKFVNGALLRVSGTAISLICRSVDLKDTAFEEVIRMRCSRLRLPASQGHHLLQVYRTLDAASARRTVRFSMARSAAHHTDAI